MKNLTLDAARYAKVRAGEEVILGRLIPGLSPDSVKWIPQEYHPDHVVCAGYYAGAVVTRVRMRGDTK